MSADARITADPPMVLLDGLELPVADAEAHRLRRLAPSLVGRVPLGDLGLSDEDATLVARLCEKGAVFDLRVLDDSVKKASFATTCMRGSRVGGPGRLRTVGRGGALSPVARRPLDTCRAFSPRTITTSAPRRCARVRF